MKTTLVTAGLSRGAAVEDFVPAPADQAIELSLKLAEELLNTRAARLKLFNNRATFDAARRARKTMAGEAVAELVVAIGRSMSDTVSDTVGCANFVSGLLVATNQIPQATASATVTTLIARLQADPNFTSVLNETAGPDGKVDRLANAVPGDVVAFESGDRGQYHHVVLFLGFDPANGKPTFIGSNNVNDDGTQRISVHGSTDPSWNSWKVIAIERYQYVPPPPASTVNPAQPQPLASEEVKPKWSPRYGPHPRNLPR